MIPYLVERLKEVVANRWWRWVRKALVSDFLAHKIFLNLVCCLGVVLSCIVMGKNPPTHVHVLHTCYTWYLI